MAVWPDIAVIGPAGSGKTSLSQFLIEHYGYTKLSFAEPLKRIAAQLWENPGREEHQQLGMKVREIHEDTWANMLEHKLEGIEKARHRSSLFTYAPIVIDDARFWNEAEMLRGWRFKFVRLDVSREEQIARLTSNGRFQNAEQLDHPSEHGLDEWPVDALLNTTDMDLFDEYAELVKLVGRWQLR